MADPASEFGASSGPHEEKGNGRGPEVDDEIPPGAHRLPPFEFGSRNVPGSVPLQIGRVLRTAAIGQPYLRQRIAQLAKAASSGTRRPDLLSLRRSTVAPSLQAASGHAGIQVLLGFDSVRAYIPSKSGSYINHGQGH